MKKTTFLLLLAFGFITCQATVYTVSNYTPTTGQFADVQSAIDAASNGDTVYVHGSLNWYAYPGGLTISKQLVLIGPGFNPRKTNSVTATLEYSGPSCTIGGDPKCMSILPGASGTVIMGFSLSNRIDVAAGVNSITIRRCYFQGNICGAGVTFNGNDSGNVVVENYFKDARIACSNNSYLLIANNVFLIDVANGGPYGISNLNGSGSNRIITNNIFYSLYFNLNAVSNVVACDVTNNIFNQVNPNFASCNAANNINYNTTSIDPWNVNGNSDLGDNVLNTDPQFVNQALIDLGTFTLATDFFSLAPGSPCLSSGATDPDMGVEGGGIFNYVNADASMLPFIYSLHIPVNTVPAGGSIQIEVISKKHD
jgi:hypothetical protein